MTLNVVRQKNVYCFHLFINSLKQSLSLWWCLVNIWVSPSSGESWSCKNTKAISNGPCKATQIYVSCGSDMLRAPTKNTFICFCQGTHAAANPVWRLAVYSVGGSRFFTYWSKIAQEPTNLIISFHPYYHWNWQSNQHLISDTVGVYKTCNTPSLPLTPT